MNRAIFQPVFQFLQFIQGKITQEFIIANHQLIGDGHYFPEYIIRRFVYTDIVPQGFRHLVNTVKTFQKRHGYNGLRRLPPFTLQLTSDQKIEFLVRPPKFNISLECDRVVALN